MNKQTILVVDDESSHRMMLKAHLGEEGYEVIEASDGQEAVDLVSQHFYDLILMDIRMSIMDGIEALHRIKKISPSLPIIMMTAYGSIESAVATLKSGADDYLTKPLDMDELLLKIEKVLHYRDLEKENILNRERLGERFHFSNIIGKSQSMKELFETLAMVAPTDATVLLLGESGTGKEVIANAIHQNSLRKDQAYIKVNCAALPETLLESELFGHEKGSFTGAQSKRKGRFELADGGTLFLDEIGEMSPATQAKILRVLQEKEFEPVGGNRTISVDVRIIAATHKDLGKEVKEGRFREDLFYRLNVVPITIAPLRDKKEDIPLLAEHFLKQYAGKNNKDVKTLEPRVMDALVRYPWPGNVRELENIIERMVIMSHGDRLLFEDLPQDFKTLPNGNDIKPGPTGSSLKEIEKEVILKTLEQTGGNRTKAALILGVTRKTLQNKIREYRIVI
ncbi:MAG: two-component system response regulator [Deltaproteobacteria bacterium HGW-Deltaproteobacteria-1]|jgi:two-component system response regulator HydG|nr:MAG: two-component system response regulator [Deltaproteobacteria bacterium HGW-Deltaproteobacteria-1]